MILLIFLNKLFYFTQTIIATFSTIVYLHCRKIYKLYPLDSQYSKHNQFSRVLNRIIILFMLQQIFLKIFIDLDLNINMYIWVNMYIIESVFHFSFKKYKYAFNRKFEKVIIPQPGIHQMWSRLFTVSENENYSRKTTFFDVEINRL